MLLLLDKDHSCLSAKRAGLLDRLAVRVHASKLDREIADGASPDDAEPLALRAQMLVRPSVRQGLARSLQKLLALATAPSRAPRLPAPLCLDRVRDASDEFQLLIDRLRVPAPVPAQGVARTTVLLSDGCGPLYHRDNEDDLRAKVRDVAETLSPLSSW